MKKVLLSLSVGLLIVATVFLIPTLWGKPWKIEHFYMRVFAGFAIDHPMLLSSLRILEPMGLDFHSDDLDDMSIEFARSEARWLDKQLEILRRYDRASLEDQLSYDILEWYMEDAQQGNRFMFHNYPVNQLGGIQSGLPEFMVNTHQIGDVGGARDYLSRLEKFGTAFDQVIDGLRHREAIGIVPPRFVVDRVLDQMREFVSAAPGEHLLYRHLEEKLGELESLEAGDRASLLAETEDTIRDVVYPAYGRLIAFLEHQEQIATSDDGVWKFPEGEAFYAYQLRHHTTTQMTADEVHQLGLDEVERLQAEMEAILVAEGHGELGFAAAMNTLNEEERFLYPDSDEGRARILEDYKSIIAEIDKGLAPMFDVRPQAGVDVRRIPEFREETAPGAYYDAAPFDGSRPGVFYVNLRSVREIPRFGMRTLAYHEAIPGHHFQIGIQQELEGLPFFRRIVPFTAFSEGWALYAEKVAAENGFQDDPYDRLGYLTGQIFRAVRLVVDTGIHAKRWTREQAIEYMLLHTGMPETDVVAEIERYIVNPGQACAYKVGQLAILDLREEAQRRLGERFDIRAFHDVVLTNGAVPLSILERLVDQWIAEART